MSALALSSADLREFDGEARVQDLRLAEVLGFENPANVRRLIRNNIVRLEQHGPIFSAAEKFPGQKRGPAATVYYLNEKQAYRLCMFSDAPFAERVQAQMVEVFFAYRQGRLISTTDADPRWAMLDKRLDQLERLITSQDMIESPAFTKAATYAPSIFRLIKGDGTLRKQNYSPRWHDHEVRALMISLHRQMTLDASVAAIAAELGAERAPSRSALGRIWKQLDKARGAA